MKNNLTTEAGLTEHTQNKASSNNKDLIDTINQVFALFKLNYHNQFYKAFTQASDLNSTKRLWLESLSHFPTDIMLRAAKSVMESSEYLPTLHTMLKHCEEQSLQSLPDVHSAYLEACRAPSPKSKYQWSHPAVYFAGRNSDWYFLQNNSESVAFPVFKHAYLELCREVRRGKIFDIPQTEQISEESSSKADEKTTKKHISSLKSMFD